MSSLLRLLGWILPYRRKALGTVLGSMAANGLQLAGPAILAFAVDQAITSWQARLLLPAALALVGVALLKALSLAVNRYLIELVSQRVIFDLRNALYAHLQRLSFSFYDRTPTGELMSRVTSDVETTRRFIGFGIPQLVTTVVLTAGIVTAMILTHWKLALITLAAVPAMGIAAREFGRRIRGSYLKVQAQLGRLTTVLQESLAGVRVVRAFGGEKVEEARFDRENEVYLDHNLAAVKIWAAYAPMLTFLAGVGTAFVLLYGGREVASGRLTLGELFAFNAYLLLFAHPIRGLGFVIGNLEQTVASSRRIFELLDTVPEIKDAPRARELKHCRGRVAFEKVTFGYPGGQEVLRDFQLEVEPGERVAVVGPTGCGKTSVIQLLPRFYDPREGRITVDGQDLREIKLTSLRRQIALVAQEPFLFSTTVRENIAYGRPGASAEEVEAAARSAQAHSFIEGLPQGYDTPVGERGVNLSGGQKQRIAIARAILMDPPILVLDEWTSSLDSETEFMVAEALENLVQGRTTFLISHRPFTLRLAQRIVVLQEGSIIREGGQEILGEVVAAG
ncbi:MAG: ABC transporter ATP-binding protein [Firmicutes bacterium]|nr:ABC transporter ATP-binding protein [Bacillota bacterium]